MEITTVGWSIRKDAVSIEGESGNVETKVGKWVYVSIAILSYKQCTPQQLCAQRVTQ
jgi:hypothetical protein